MQPLWLSPDGNLHQALQKHCFLVTLKHALQNKNSCLKHAHPSALYVSCNMLSKL